jgi:pyrroloquinoline quinone biosynthesis protein D
VSSAATSLGDRPRLAAKARLRPDGPSGKLALLSPENIMLLNASGAAIVELCDGRTVAEIVMALGHRFSAPPERLQTEVIGYLTRLRDKGLVELAPGVGA